MADSYTISFKEGTGTTSDGSNKQTTVEGIISEGASYVSAVAATEVYNARVGRGIKLGSSKNPGSLTLTLANPVNATSIVVSARRYNDKGENGLTIQGQAYELVAEGDFADYTYTYDEATEITEIVLTSGEKRNYMLSVTVNYGEGGEVTPPEPEPSPIESTYFASGEGWTEDTESSATWDAAAKKITVNLVQGKQAQWQAQVKYQGPVAQEGKLYDFTATLKSTATIGGVTIKYQDNDAEMFYDPAIELVAGEELVYAKKDLAGVSGGNGIVVFDFGFAPAGTVIEIYDIAIVEKDPAPEVKDPANCAEAAAAALTVEKNNDLYNDGKVYTIQGYVTSIATAYNSQYNNISFWMADTKDGGNVLQAFRAACATAEDAPAVGDLVKVTGKLTKYGSTPEFAAGCTYEIIEKSTTPVVEPVNLGAKTIAEFLALKNTKDTCVLTGVVSNIVNTQYGNFDLVDETGTIYVYGLLTADGKTKQFASLNVAEGDTLTALAIYSEYNGTPQAKNAIFVEVKKKAVEPGEDVEVTISYLTAPGALIWTDAVAAEGWWQIYGGTEDYDFSISNVSTTETAGVYTIDDLDAKYSYISLYGETDTVDVAFKDGSVTVAIAEDGTVTVNGTLVGEDGNNYIFNLTYKDPVAEKTVNVQIAEWQLADTYLSYGLFAVGGTAADNTYVQFALWMAEDQENIAGDYTEGDFDYRYIGTGLIDANGEQPMIFSATIHIEETGEAVVVTADLLCYNNTLYKVTTLTEGIDNANAVVKAIKSIVNGQLIIEKNGVQYNAMGTVIR